MNRIRELRKEKGLTQLQFCQKLNITQSTLSGWECGRWQPDNDTLIKLAEYFSVTVDYILGRNESFSSDDEQKNIIERPPYDITDKQLIDFIKLYKVMTDLQKAQVFGYVVAMLEGAGINVKSVLNR